jgi:hypothetical protein
MADALASGASGGNPVEVRLLSTASVFAFQASPDKFGFNFLRHIQNVTCPA